MTSPKKLHTVNSFTVAFQVIAEFANILTDYMFIRKNLFVGYRIKIKQKIICSRSGSNLGPVALKANVITITPQKSVWNCRKIGYIY